MKARDFEEALRQLIVEADHDLLEELGLKVRSVRTFEEASLLTNNRGLVVKLVDGSEFQLEMCGTYQNDEEDEGRCPDCGEKGERKGHQACQYPQD